MSGRSERILGAGTSAIAPDPRTVAEREIIAVTFRNVWPSLPALTIASAAVCLAAVVPIVVVPGLNPLAAILAATCIAPFGAALVAVVQQMAGSDHGTLATWRRTLRRQWRFAIGHALVVAVPFAAFLAALHVLDRTGAPWVWPSLAVSGAASVLTALGLTAVIPLGLADRAAASSPAPDGLSLWLAALALVAARPSRFVAVVAAAGFVVWLGSAVSASLLLFVPAPAAIVAVTATWTAAATTADATATATATRSSVPSGES